MRGKLTFAAVMCLLIGSLAAAPPAVATSRSLTFSTYSAGMAFQSDPTLSGPGVHWWMDVRYERYPDEQIIQINSVGWDNGPDCCMYSQWYWTYEKVLPLDPDIGGVAPNLSDAWASFGPLDFQCWGQGPNACPTMPSQLAVSIRWKATGPMNVEAYQDDTGTPTLQTVRRWRDASADLEFSYPAGDGPLPLPALLVRTEIAWYHQSAVGPGQ